jgi:hypothetical protein
VRRTISSSAASKRLEDGHVGIRKLQDHLGPAGMIAGAPGSSDILPTVQTLRGPAMSGRSPSRRCRAASSPRRHPCGSASAWCRHGSGCR